MEVSLEYYFSLRFNSICLVIESNYFITQTTDFLANDNYILFSIVVTIYAVKNPSGNNTDLNEKLSRAKEYLTKDEILDVLLDDDGNLSPNLTNNKELEVGCKVKCGFCLRVKSKARSMINDQLKIEANTCHVCQARENW